MVGNEKNAKEYLHFRHKLFKIKSKFASADRKCLITVLVAS